MARAGQRRLLAARSRPGPLDGSGATSAAIARAGFGIERRDVALDFTDARGDRGRVAFQFVAEEHQRLSLEGSIDPHVKPLSPTEF